ncbi:MAG: neutral zinc metallopeptidase [Proteobacteria bacterium]|nr:neutral zinc metallopeptidase [Pseudomonadota bacterium]
MKMDGRRESSNVVDNRKKNTKAAVGGVGGVSVVAVVLYFILSGGQVDPAVVSQLSNSKGHTQTVTAAETRNSEFYKNSSFENQDALAKFTSQVLASTEETWTGKFKEMNKQYAYPKMMLFTGEVDTACGHASSSFGPFYCSGDQTVYIDLEFLETMKKTLRLKSKEDNLDFAFAYVIAHEVGHHVQNLTGDLAKYNRQEAALKKQGNTAAANLVSVQIELQADCYAGVWGRTENELYKSLDADDFSSAFDAAKGVGDDTLGNTRRDTFSHGSAKMRQAWFATGFTTGDPAQCDTYKYTSLDALESKKY